MKQENEEVGKRLQRQIEKDIESLTAKVTGTSVAKKYQFALNEIDRLKVELNSAIGMRKNIDTYTIKPSKQDPHSTNEATAVIVASDWHYEELIKASTVSYKNEYTIDIANERIDRFFQSGMRLVKVLERDIPIKHIVLALLGDFITGNIHEELMEGNQLLPMEAILEVQRKIASGIEFFLANFKGTIVVPCHSGNHARITHKQRVATEAGNSLENYMYQNLAIYFQKEERVKFIISEGYHSYLTIYDTIIRFHHGHSLKYNGGVGGLTVPVNKAINEWNKAIRADIDVFGHWHQMFDGGNFICNGSLIGYGAYSIKIKAAFERPKQAFFLIDKKRGKTWTTPILLTD